LHLPNSFIVQLKLRSAFDQQLDVARAQLHAAQAENAELKNSARANEASLHSLQDSLNRAVQRYKDEQTL
jgi:hypothetical protein